LIRDPDILQTQHQNTTALPTRTLSTATTTATVMSISTVLAAYAAATVTAPGRASSLEIATGRVGSAGVARNTVAPNCPSVTANAKPTATVISGSKRGTATDRTACQVDRPSTAATSR